MPEQQFQAVFLEPQKPRGKVYIDVPFNVWEVFNKKGVVAVNGCINGYPYKCNLIPRGEGKYLLLLTKSIQKGAGITPGDILKITMNLDKNKIEKEKDIAPSLDVTKPKMKIPTINYVPQSTFKTCGQACIAMLAGVNIEEAIKIMHTSSSTSIGQLIEALDYYQIKHAEKNKRISKKNPQCSEVSILTVHMPNYTHWVLYYKGKFFDPEFGVLDKCHPKGKITSFLEIYLDE